MKIFLAISIGALGKGFEASGHGPGAFARGFGGAVGAPLQMQQQQQQFAQQQQMGQAQIEAEQASTAQRQRQTELSGAVKFIKPVQDPNNPNKVMYGAYDAQGNFLKTLDNSIDPSALQKFGIETAPDGNGGYTHSRQPMSAGKFGGYAAPRGRANGQRAGSCTATTRLHFCASGAAGAGAGNQRSKSVNTSSRTA